MHVQHECPHFRLLFGRVGQRTESTIQKVLIIFQNETYANR